MDEYEIKIESYVGWEVTEPHITLSLKPNVLNDGPVQAMCKGLTRSIDIQTC